MARTNDLKLQTEYELLRKKRWRYLRKGVIFLAICLGVSQLVQNIGFPFADLISESLIIAGWVGLWRPLEIFLYELPEVKEQLK